MRSAPLLLLPLALGVGKLSGCCSTTPSASAPTAAPADVSGPNIPSFKVTSILVKEGQTIPDRAAFNGFGCNGGNVSPDLAWNGEPPEAKSFAVIAYDPDAPTGVGFFHWNVTNIPAGTHGLEAGAGDAKSPKLPAGAVNGFADFGASGYGGPCPPPGKPHRYQFTVYALDVPHLNTDANTTGAKLRFMLRDHTLAQGTLTGLYGR